MFDSLTQQKLFFAGGLIRMVGRISITSPSCSNPISQEKSAFSKGTTGCRKKRQAKINIGPNNSPYNHQEIHIRLETPKHLFDEKKYNPTKSSTFRKTYKDTVSVQKDKENIQREHGKSEVMLHLVHSPQIVAPNFKLIVRDASNNIISTNQTVAFPSCLYTGTVDGIPEAKVSLSTCGGIQKLVS